MRLRLRPNITLKLIGYLMVLSVLPLLVVGIVSYRISHRILREEASKYTSELVIDQRDYLDLQLEQIESLLANISGVEEIREALSDQNASTDTFTNLATQARIGYILNGYSNLKGLVSIDIFTEGGVHYHVGDTLNVENTRVDVVDRISSAARQSSRFVYWAGIEDNVNANSTDAKVLTAAKVLTQIERETLLQKPIALFLVNYGVDTVYEQFSRIDLGEDAYLMVVDAMNRIIYHPNKTLIGQRISDDFVRLLENQQGTFTETIDGETMFISYASSDLSGWHVLSVIPMTTLTARTGVIGATTVFVLLICFVIVGFFSLSISKNLVAPVREITQRFKLFQSGDQNWQDRMEIRGNDEIADLTRWFNSFADSLAAKQRSEQALRESEERYALAVRGANDGLWDWDMIRNEIYLSPRWKSILGYSESEMSDNPLEWLDRIHPDDRRPVEATIRAHLEGSTPHFENEHRLRHKDGSYRWVLARGLAVSDDSNRPCRMTGSHTDITDRKLAEEKLRHDALYDSLTGLPNRALFMERLGRAMNDGQQGQAGQFAVLFLDMDDFKMTNDSLGHNVGDELLIQVADRLKRCVGPADTVARLGGDEFVILLENLNDLKQATETAERILNSLSQPFSLQGREMISGASLGIIPSSAGHQRADLILRDADVAMYRAKALGKNRYVIFDTVMREEILSRLSLEMELRRAIENQEFSLQYQPIVSLKTGWITGFEALLRWHHPTRGEISPEQFIPLAEETGLILPIDRWVLHEACHQAQRWQELFPMTPPLGISVNLSGKQLDQADTVDSIRDVLDSTGLDPQCLHLEVTESAIIRDVQAARETLERIRGLGIEIQMDDFGIGYSALSYLYHFGVDAIKIDRSFVLAMDRQDRAAGLVRAVLTIARDLGARVIAEGVETPDQAKKLLEMGCEQGQGFLISRPQDAAAVEAFLLQHFGSRPGVNGHRAEAVPILVDQSPESAMPAS